jgi:hypothetical protein
MTQVEVLNAARDRVGGYKVDVTRGERVGRVSSEWFSRPADERYLSLSDLYAAVRGRTERSRTRTVETAAIRVEASRDDAERLALLLPGAEAPIAPTHWSFGQLAGLVGAPSTYLRQLPAPLAGINLQYGLTSHRAEQVKTLEIQDDRIELRAVTGPDYGRIFDHELVAAVQRIAGNGTGDTLWKVARRHHPGHDNALRLRSRRLPFLGRRPQSDRGGATPRRFARPLFPRLLLLEFRGWGQDARYRELLSPRRLPEPQPLGRRGFRGDHHPPLEIRRRALRA